MNSGSEGSENSHVIYIWILLLKFTYEFICKFTYEFICHRFFGHEHPKCSHCDGSILSYTFLQNDPKSQNLHVRWLNFVLQIPTKGHPTRKKIRLRRLDFTFKPLQKNIQITKFSLPISPLVWFYHWKYTIRGRHRRKCCHSSLFRTGFEGFSNAG